MMYIVMSHGSEFQWWVGQPIEGIKLDLIAEVQADGDELDRIRNTVIGLPDCPKARVVRWTGDNARFIVANVVSN